jgi:hypothetical protein
MENHLMASGATNFIPQAFSSFLTISTEKSFRNFEPK